MYIKVYAPDGEMFEVTRDRADRLILSEGWTQTKVVPKVEEEEEEVPLFEVKRS